MAGDENLKSLLRIGIVLLCVGAAVLIVAILSSERGGTETGNALATAVTLAFLTLPVAAGLNLAARQPGLAPLGYLTIVVVAIAFVATMNLVWNHSWLMSPDGASRWAWYTLIGAFALGNTSALLAGHDDLDPDSVKLVRLGTVLALWALVITVIAEIRTSGHDVDPKQMGITAVVYGLGLLVLPLLRRATG